MIFPKSALVILAMAAPSSAFVGTHSSFVRNPALASSVAENESSIEPGMDAAIRRELNYKPGEAGTEFAERYKHLVGAKVKTVGESFADFTRELGYTVNPLYKNMVTDIVGTTHLIVVSARFKRDPVWSLGILTALDLLLKNYPEKDVGNKIVSALFKSVGLDEAEIRAEAKMLEDWAEGKTREDIEAGLSGEGSSPIAQVAQAIKADKYWMYSRYFGIGLVKLMEKSGMEMDKDEVYPIMENWMTEKLGRSHLTACSDSDLFFKVKEKLDMMETMMKEIEIREKKRMAERLEEKAEAALRAVDKEKKMQEEIDAENKKNLDKVDA